MEKNELIKNVIWNNKLNGWDIVLNDDRKLFATLIIKELSENDFIYKIELNDESKSKLTKEDIVWNVDKFNNKGWPKRVINELSIVTSYIIENKSEFLKLKTN
jgi:hypothetical protein